MTTSRGLFPEELLRTCMSCGFCLPACPTYQDTRRESSSPRGRISLMRALDSGVLVEEDVADELSFCLGCRACETVCPAGVQYGALLEHARDAVGPEPSRVLKGLLWGVASPGRTTLVARALRAGQALGLTKLAPSATLRASAAATPKVPSTAKRTLDEWYGPADGDPCALFLGCVGHVMFSPAAHASAALLAAAGYRVHVPRTQGCCGALHGHNGSLDGARKLAGSFMQAFAESDGPIVTTAGGCGAFLADYGHLLESDAARVFGARVKDVSELLVGRTLSFRADLPPLRVAYQDSCHLKNGQKVAAEPRTLIASVPGVELVDLPLAGRCCGAAGSYSLLRPDDSQRFLDPKLAEIQAAEVDVIVSGNTGCLLQFRQGVGDAGVRVVHTMELLHERLATSR